MPRSRANEARYSWEAKAPCKVTAYGGLLLVEAVLRHLGVWQKVEAACVHSGEKTLALQRTAQLLYSFACGHSSMAAACSLGNDVLVCRLLGLTSPTDESALKKWLEEETKEFGTELKRINTELTRSILGRWFPPRFAENGNEVSWLNAVLWDERCSFFQITGANGYDVQGSSNAIARLLALGPVILEATHTEDYYGEQLIAEVRRIATLGHHLWRNYKVYLCTSTLVGLKGWPELMRDHGVANWVSGGVSRRDANEALNRGAERTEWSSPQVGNPDVYGRTWPRDIDIPGRLLVAARMDANNVPKPRAYLVADPHNEEPTEDAFTRYWNAETQAKEFFAMIVNDDCLNLNGTGRELYTIIAVLAYNALIVVRHMLEAQSKTWTLERVIREIVTTPGILSTSSRYNTVRLAATSQWPKGWQRILELAFGGTPGDGAGPDLDLLAH